MGKLYCEVEKKWCKFLKRGVCTYSKTKLDSIEKCPRIEEIETRRLYDLLHTVDFDNVFDRLTFWFNDQDDQKEGYRGVFEKLLSMEPHKHNLADMFITIQKVPENGRDYLDTLGFDWITKKTYAIEFVPWNDWVSMCITKETLDLLSDEEIVAACLYEMTFCGFNEEQIRGKEENLKNVLEETLKNE